MLYLFASQYLSPGGSQVTHHCHALSAVLPRFCKYCSNLTRCIVVCDADDIDDDNDHIIAPAAALPPHSLLQGH